MDTDTEVLVTGEALVDFLPESTGPLTAVEGFTRRPGGAPANVAVGLAALDRVPYFWTRVGDDPFGDALVDALAEHGVPDRFLERDPAAKTSLAFVEHGDAGERSFTFYRDGTADTRLQPGTIPDETLESIRWVYAGGVALASEPSRSATLELLERARSHDATVLFDPNARPQLWDDGFPDVTRRALARSDVVKATVDDLAVAGFEGGPDDLAEAVHAAGPHTLLLTLGGAGSRAFATDEAPWGPGRASHKGYDVDPVDTTGAGDAFTAGALAALGDGDSLVETLAFANAVAAITTTAPGAMTALPDREIVTSFRGD